jgi:hypothetical protein
MPVRKPSRQYAEHAKRAADQDQLVRLLHCSQEPMRVVHHVATAKWGS